MKISFLIPSKNRLGLLKQAVASIFDQSEIESEVIISDNASDEDYKAYVDELNDPRAIYFRQPKGVSVTENWQKSLSLATGDYILMLGDDDALAPSFSKLLQYVTADGPDLIYLAAYHYCYPNVIAGSPVGFFASVLNSEFFSDKSEPFTLDRAYAHELAESVLAFHHRFGLNAQHFLLKSSFIKQFDRIGGLYQSPYPDTFSSVAIFIHAASILVIPKESVIIGISPHSFGAYYFSGRHDEGYRFLDNEQVDPATRASLQSVILPGDRNNTNWLVAAECVRQALPSDLRTPVNFARYRTLQMISILRDAYMLGRREGRTDVREKLSAEELPLFDSLDAEIEIAAQNGLAAKTFDALTARIRQYEPAKVTYIDIGQHAQIWDAYVWLKEGGRTAKKNGLSDPAGAPATERPSEGPADPQQPGGDTRSSLYMTVRSLVRSAALMVPPVHRLHQRASINAKKAEQLQAENAALRAQIQQSQTVRAAAPSLPDPSVRIIVQRDARQFAITPDEFDAFAFQSGDELSLTPAAMAVRFLRTPDGHHHVPLARVLGLRVPPKINLVSYRGFLIPEHLLALTGAGFETFDGIGRAHIDNYRKFVGLDSDMSFLEIGSGIGRDAFQLIDVLGPNGRYLGIDVQRESIVWCQRNITARYPNIRFHHFNAFHELHNPIATKSTADFQIPLPDNSVDRVVLGSVFTHIFADEVAHYLKEIARVLKSDGRVYATFFLYTEEAVAASRRNNLTPYNLKFEHPYGDGCYVNDPVYPTGAVAYTDEAMRKMIAAAGLTLVRPYLKGMWSGYYANGDDGQDVAVLGH